MIIGLCPYDDCQATVMTPLAEGPLPQVERLTCGGCGRVYWLRHARLDPVAYPEDRFLAEFEVVGGTVQPRGR